jgi:hypothetical protein
MTTLENSYCVPRTVEEWDMLYPKANWLGQYPCEHSHVYSSCGGHKYLASWPNDDPNKTEIPVSHFLDLLHDRIAWWRLEEVGFLEDDDDTWCLNTESSQVRCYGDVIIDRIVLWPDYAEYSSNIYITTFTDLLTFIRMLTPPPEET